MVDQCRSSTTQTHKHTHHDLHILPLAPLDLLYTALHHGADVQHTNNDVNGAGNNNNDNVK